MRNDGNEAVTHDNFFTNMDAILDLYLDGSAPKENAQQSFTELHEARSRFFHSSPIAAVHEGNAVSLEQPIKARVAPYDHEKEGI